MAEQLDGQPEFTIVLLGYDRPQVDAYLADLGHGHRPDERAPKFRRALRGYATNEVDDHVRRLLSDPAS